MNVRIRKNWKIIAIVAVLLLMVGIIPVSAAPNANFTNATPRSGTAPLTVFFTDTSTEFTEPIYLWDFGEGNTSTDRNPSNTYYTVGSYSVNLTVTNLTGESYSENKPNYITVNGVAPVASFTPSATSGTAPLSVTFTDTSSNTPTIWSWSFRNVTGNNTETVFSTIKNPTHSFGVGNYSIVMNASNSAGFDLSQVTFINVSAAVVAPVASFTPSATSGTAPLAVTFTDTSSNTPTAWNWSFRNVTGNNTQVWWSQVRNPPPMTFGVGNFSIVLNASNSAGYDISNQVTFINVTPVAPVAGFSGTPVSGSKPLTVVFRDASNGVVTSYAWNFGDGNTSAIRNPSHIYSTVGNYTVNLTVTGPGGSGFENKPNYITVMNATTKIGVYNDGVWNLNNNEAISDLTFTYGQPGDIPIVGDWTGSGKDTVGIYRNGAFYLRNSNSNGFADLTFGYGNLAGDIPIVGDWDRSGNDTVGVFRNGVFYLRNSNSNGFADWAFTYGQPGDIPLTGDWNGDGKNEVGIFREGVWYLDYNGDGVSSSGTKTAYSFRGEAGWTPIVGDWNGGGTTKIGVYKDGDWYLDYNGNGIWDNSVDKECHISEQKYTTPFVGDWNGDGKTKVGYYLNGYWYLDYSGEGAYSRFAFLEFPQPGFTPVVGDWNGNGKTKVGVYKYSNGDWYLDYDGNGVWNATVDKKYNLGGSGWITVVGDWNGDGKSKMGVYRATDGDWHLDYDGNGVWNATVDKEYNSGVADWKEVVGDWNGDGRSKIGVYNSLIGDWNLDYDGNGVWNASVDKGYNIGVGTPVVGKWS